MLEKYRVASTELVRGFKIGYDLFLSNSLFISRSATPRYATARQSKAKDFAGMVGGCTKHKGVLEEPNLEN
jgi:hypothetical protein